MPRPRGSKNKPKDQTMATTGTAVTVMPPAAAKSVIGDMADRFGMEPAAFEAALRATVVPKDVSAAQFAAFLMVAKEYSLNPLTKEIYAFPSRGGGIVPIVSVDGWVNLVNAQGQCDGFEFTMEEQGERLISCTCTMHRKDRKHPVVVTEYFSECARSTDPWKMKHRMLRHKSFIQAARYAFGFSGIYDEDEGQKIAEIDPNKDAAPPRTITQQPAEPADPAPPRTAAPAPEPGPGEEYAAGEVQDAAPPRRAAPPKQPKEDPITSGPQSRKDAAPKPKEITPFKLPGAGETYETWSEKYIDNIKTAGDTATLFKWIDLNADPLARLAKGKPSVYSTVKTATEKHRERLQDVREKAEKAAAKKKPAAPPPSEMEDGPTSGEMEESLGGTPDAPTDPEAILKAIDAELAAVEDPDQLQATWDSACEELAKKLEFPPDQDAAQGIFNKHEKRLGGD